MRYVTGIKHYIYEHLRPFLKFRNQTTLLQKENWLTSELPEKPYNFYSADGSKKSHTAVCVLLLSCCLFLSWSTGLSSLKDWEWNWCWCMHTWVYKRQHLCNRSEFSISTSQMASDSFCQRWAIKCVCIGDVGLTTESQLNVKWRERNGDMTQPGGRFQSRQPSPKLFGIHCLLGSLWHIQLLLFCYS